MKVLNLYACLGGNRYKWIDCDVTAVELDPVLAKLYQERFPGDTVVIGDAHKYLLDHYKEFDFIWSSPPCQTHSRARFWGFGANGKNPVYPDMKLYEEIIFLRHHCKKKYVVENVKSYYEPIFNPQERNRHLYWANFELPKDLGDRKAKNFIHSKVCELSDFHDYDFTKYKGEQRIDKIARNLVDYEAGLTIFNTAKGLMKANDSLQLTSL